MSAGAVFKLIANDGKADHMIMATELLNERIKALVEARRRAGMADTTPSLVDLERTHILYVNAHFKPYAAIGYEYNKVRPIAGNAVLGSSVQFNIPNFGDFFFDMVCRIVLSAFTSSTLLTPLPSKGSANAPSPFPFNGQTPEGGFDPTKSYNVVDITGRILVAGAPIEASARQARQTQETFVDEGYESMGEDQYSEDATEESQMPYQRSEKQVRSFKQVASTRARAERKAVPYKNHVRYCEYPGHRLFKRVKFEVNGNPLDEYTDVVPVMLEKFCTAPNKKIGYDKLVGQEVPLTGYGGLSVNRVIDIDAKNTPSGISRMDRTQSNQTIGVFHPGQTGITSPGIHSASALNAFSTTPQVDVSREKKTIVNGPQTPKPVQPPLEIWNKLRFWFNEDVRLSIPSVSIPFGQRYITIDLNPQDMLAFEQPSIFLETITEKDLLRTKTYSPIFLKGNIGHINVEEIDLFINNIFVNPEIHDIYIKKIGFSLIRVYREQQTRVMQENGSELLLSQLKWPIEYMFIGMRPAWNVKPIVVGNGGVIVDGNPHQWRDWHRMGKVATGIKDNMSFSEISIPTPTMKEESVLIKSGIGQIMPDEYYIQFPCVDSISLQSHGIVIFDQLKDTFFNAYMPYHFGGQALNTPEDPGALFVNFALFPRNYQPSGHLNISRARETYLKWKTSYISPQTPADLFIAAVAINFLLITDGSKKHAGPSMVTRCKRENKSRSNSKTFHTLRSGFISVY